MHLLAYTLCVYAHYFPFFLFRPIFLRLLSAVFFFVFCWMCTTRITRFYSRKKLNLIKTHNKVIGKVELRTMPQAFFLLYAWGCVRLCTIWWSHQQIHWLSFDLYGMVLHFIILRTIELWMRRNASIDILSVNDDDDSALISILAVYSAEEQWQHNKWMRFQICVCVPKYCQ